MRQLLEVWYKNVFLGHAIGWTSEHNNNLGTQRTMRRGLRELRAYTVECGFNPGSKKWAAPSQGARATKVKVMDKETETLIREGVIRLRGKAFE